MGNIRSIIIAFLMVGFFSLEAFGGQDPSQSDISANLNEIVLEQAQANQKVVLSERDVIVVRLKTTPATGFSWRIVSMDSKILKHANASKFGPEIECPNPFVPGEPCTQVLRFVGKSAGRSKIDLVYDRAWEKNSEPKRQSDQTFSIDVDVKKAFRGTYNASRAATEAPRDPGPITAPGVPAYFDWRDQGAVTSVKDQGSCGSCWAFGATAVVESQIAMVDGVQKDLSEQYLVSCNDQGSSCAGGWWTYDYFIDNPGYDTQAGAVYESDFPYYAYDAPCNPPYPHHEKLSSWAYVDDVPDTQIPYYDHNPSTLEVKQKIYSNGPVGTVVCSNTWGGYYGGIFYDHCSTPTHIVMITGWNDAEGVFYIKNSWGSSWGEGGYMRLPYGYCLVGYQSTYASYGGGITNNPVAMANGPYTGEVNVPINFSSAGSYDPDGSIVAYEWNFGDGSTSTQANPSHTYTSAGTYTVQLTVTDNSGLTGSDQTQAVISSTVPGVPVAVANGPYSGEPGVPISFSSAGSYDPDGQIVAYQWDFGDGSTSTQANPSHAYATEGTFAVSLTVTDNSGMTGTDQTQAVITKGGQFITTEQEPNNDRSSANGPVGSGHSFTGTWDTSDQDYFYFDVNSPTMVNISVDVTGGTNTSVTFVVYHESDPYTYVTWDQSGPPNMSASFSANMTGRYYLVTYTWASGGSYRATVTW